jgi:hypothetical protein
MARNRVRKAAGARLTAVRAPLLGRVLDMMPMGAENDCFSAIIMALSEPILPLQAAQQTVQHIGSGACVGRQGVATPEWLF